MAGSGEVASGFVAEAENLQAALVDLRRRLHGVPELGLELPRTKGIVLEALSDLPLGIVEHSDTSGVVGILRGGAEGAESGPIVLLRADMDALPLKEQTGLPIATVDPRMHACGHDLHTAMLVGAARLLVGEAHRLGGTVVFMFQPGEEGYDGARHMIDSGVLKAGGRQADAAYALHVNPAVLPFGTIATRGGTLLSAVANLKVRVIGEGGHGSRPHRAKDPVPVLAEIVLALQALVTRQFDVFDPVILTVGVLQAGTKFNIIPDEARLEATVRTFSDAHAREIGSRATLLCEGIAASYGLRAEVLYEPLYPVTRNSILEAARVLRVAVELFGEACAHEYVHPQPGSEDFSRVLDAVPGAMAFLGACPPGSDPETAAYNHSARAVYDEAVLCRGAALLAAVAWDRISSESSSAPASTRAEH
jgi:hippurate hydrolase